MKDIDFAVYGNPVAQKRHRTVNQGRLKFDPCKDSKQSFLAQCIQHRPDKPIDFPVRVDISWYIMRPSGHYGCKKGEKYLKLNAPKHCDKYDRDNLDKFVLDALNGIFWKDDKFVCCGFIEKIWSDNPRTHITIQKLE